MYVVQRAGTHLLLVCLLLIGLGLVMIYSASSELARVRYDDSSFFLKRQLARAVLGLFVMFVVSRVPLDWFARFSRFIMLWAIFLLVLVLFIGAGPADRWLYLPNSLASFAFQPSEFAKLALVIYLADVLVRKEEDLREFKRGLLPRLVVVGLVLTLIAAQPDLGTAIAIGCIALVLLWVGGVEPGQLGAVLLVGTIGIVVSLLTSPYQLARLTNFLEGNGEDAGNYQITQSLIGMGNGQVFGVGLGNSMQKLQYLPEPHTDFVFAFVGEEMGLVGTISVVGLFVAFAVLGLKIARNSVSSHGFLLATGMTSMISIYAMLNMGVVTGLLPTTGLPLPFLSYGGSSLLLNMAGVGILLCVARHAAMHSTHRAR